MRISCPHCHQHVEVVGASEETASLCPACGSNLSFALDTQTYQPPIVEIVGGFDLLERVGVGHFGEVWKARDRQLRRIVALKMPRLGRTDLLARTSFVHEAQAAAKLRHPNIVAVYDVHDEDGKIFIVSEFVEGVSLASYLRERSMTIPQAAKFCAQVADALQHAHEQRIIHRDLKPANILMDSALEPRLTDFGLAKHEGDEFTITVEGQILGTPAYMSPEQASGRGHEADGRSDVYSLGVILYEMIAGRRPFAGESQLLVHQILNEEPARPRGVRPGIPKDIETICMKAMAKEPHRRYATAADFAEDLRRYLRHEPISASPIGMPERLWLWCRRKPTSAALAAVVIVAVAAIVGILINSRSQIAEVFRKNVELSGQVEQREQRVKQSQQELEQTKLLIPLSQSKVSVWLATEPPDAARKFIPLRSFDGSPDWDKSVEAPSHGAIELVPGDYLVVARRSNGDFHEVFRRVPGDRRDASGSYPHLQFHWTTHGYDLAPIRIASTADATAGMAHVTGSSDFVMDRYERKISHRVPDYYLDQHEVTVREFRKFNSQHEAVSSSSPGDEFPVTGVSWDDAVAYAESVGKILPDELMYEYAATALGHSRFPWGDDNTVITSWGIREVGVPEHDRMNGSQPAIYGLYSGALEWTSSPAQALVSGSAHRPVLQQAALNHAIVRGGPMSALKGEVDNREITMGVTMRFGHPWSTRHPMIGFRCARSATPRWERPSD